MINECLLWCSVFATMLEIFFLFWHFFFLVKKIRFQHLMIHFMMPLDTNIHQSAEGIFYMKFDTNMNKINQQAWVLTGLEINMMQIVQPYLVDSSWSQRWRRFSVFQKLTNHNDITWNGLCFVGMIFIWVLVTDGWIEPYSMYCLGNKCLCWKGGIYY